MNGCRFVNILLSHVFLLRRLKLYGNAFRELHFTVRDGLASSYIFMSSYYKKSKFIFQFDPNRASFLERLQGWCAVAGRPAATQRVVVLIPNFLRSCVCEHMCLRHRRNT